MHMRALHLYVTIAFSLSATAYDHSRDLVPVSNRDLWALTSNTSYANSLNRNSKRTLDNPIIQRIILLKVFNGRFTATVDFGHHRMSGVVLDTGSSMTWIKAKNSATEAPPFKSMGFLKLKGQTATATVTVDKLPAREMEFRMVQPEVETNNYDGGLTLDRSRVSWENYAKRRPIFAFYSMGPDHAEFDFGGVDTKLHKQMEWYPVKYDNVWTLEHARIKVNGGAVQVLKGLSTRMDTGVQCIYGSANSVAKVYQQLRGSRFLNGFWTVPCNKPPVVSFSWGKTDFPIHDFLVDGQVHGEKYCRGIIRPRHGIPDNEFELGIGFFYGKYIAFSTEMGKIGIAITGL